MPNGQGKAGKKKAKGRRRRKMGLPREKREQRNNRGAAKNNKERMHNLRDVFTFGHDNQFG